MQIQLSVFPNDPGEGVTFSVFMDIPANGKDYRIQVHGLIPETDSLAALRRRAWDKARAILLQAIESMPAQL